MDLKSKIILISGPTASGKSNFAIRLAKKIKGEIINGDSMQIYKQIKILNARPNEKDQAIIKHHLYGFVDVKKNFSSGQWLNLVKKKVNEIRNKKKIPIIVGGTGLYFKILTDGLSKIPLIPLKIRRKALNLQKKLGQKKFYKRLIKIDKDISTLIDENDVQRSIRAFEVKLFTKNSIKDWFKKTKKIYKDDDFVKIYIDYPKLELIENINKRVNSMFLNGAIDEVKKFKKLKIRKGRTSSKMIGIDEISNFLENKTDIIEAKEKISIKTRQYAKRQRTWARGNMINWIRLAPIDQKNFLNNI